MKSGVKIVVVADANVLLSAVAKRAALKVFNTDIEVHTTEHTWAEVVKYVPKFSEMYPIPLEVMFKTLELLPLLVKPRSFYKGKWAEAKSIMDSKDPDDVDVAALALEINAPVWSNDNDFLGFPLGRYTTAELLKAIGR